MARVVTHLFGVLEVLEQGVFVPSDTLVDVGSSVGEAFCLTSLATKDTASRNTSVQRVALARENGNVPVEVGADFVGLTSGESVALSATSLEKTGTLGSVTYKGSNSATV